MRCSVNSLHLGRWPVLAALMVVISLLLGAYPLQAAPITPSIQAHVRPVTLNPAQAGQVAISGGYPLEVLVSMDGTPLDVFWSGTGYFALFSFGFDALPGPRTLDIRVRNPRTGEVLARQETITLAEFEYPLEQLALPYRLIPLLDRELNEQENEHLAQIYTGRSTPFSWDWPFSIPVPGGIVTSRFGGNRLYNGGLWAQYHTGMDFRRAVGEPIYATASGRVAAAEPLSIRGNIIILDHGHGVFSQYAHLSEALVQPGEHVRRGQIIGLAGATGRTNGPHLHFEIIVGGVPVDPIRWFALDPSFVPPREVIAVSGAGEAGAAPAP